MSDNFVCDEVTVKRMTYLPFLTDKYYENYTQEIFETINTNLKRCWNAMEFAGRVDFLQKCFCEIVTALQTEYDHAQMANSRYFETIIGFNHVFKFFC